MTDRKEFEEALLARMENASAQVGDPPTPEEMVAYARGTLSAAEMERIRAKLAYYPDLADALDEEANPSAPAAPHLSKEQLAADWESLQRRMAPQAPVTAPSSKPAVVASESTPSSDPLPFRSRNTAMWQLATAASFLLFALFGGLYFRSVSTIDAMREEFRRPRIDVERVPLYDRTTRSGSTTPTPSLRFQPTTKYVALNLTLAAETTAQQFRVEILSLDAHPPHVVWTSPIFRGSDGTFTIEVPRSFLEANRYRVDLYAEGSAQAIASYGFGVGR